MKRHNKQALAVLLSVALVFSNSLFAASQEIRGDSVSPDGTLFFTSFEDGEAVVKDSFLISTVSKDSGDKERIFNVSGSTAEQLIGDVTGTIQPGSIQGSNNFNSSEVRGNLFDNNPATKWLTNDGVPTADKPIWISFQINAPKAVTAYSIVSANDSQGRDPKSWTFYGSVDGSSWTSLDQQSNIIFSSRYQQHIFKFQNSTEYQYYKLSITANYGNSGMTQFADLNLASMDPADGTPAPIPMNTVIGTGPASVWNQKANAGWTGAKALTVSGTQVKDSNGGYCYNVIYDNLDIPVTDTTRLSYVIFPQYVGDDYDFKYTSMYVAVDLEFSDGTYLSESGAVDQNGNVVSPLAQGKSRTLTTRQWNQISTYLNTGNLTGKTITNILVGYQNDQSASDGAMNFLDYIDDIRIENSAPKTYSHLSDYVNILRGTNDSSGFSRGLTAPAVTLPHGFNFWVPVTQSNDNKMYNYQDNMLQHITISHEPSYWVGDRGTWQFMVNTSLVPGSTSIGTDQRAAKFSHDNETAKPYCYSVKFTEGNAAGSRVEVSPTQHAAAIRFTFDSTAANRNVIFDDVRATGTLSYGDDNKSFTARTDQNSNGMQSMYVYGEFDTAFTNATAVNGKSGMVSFPAGTSSVTLKVATSFISADQAKENLQQEIGSQSFDDVYSQAQKTWDDQLGIVQIEGATEDQLTTFYSCMYRLFAYPNLLAENTGGGAKDGWQYRSPYGSHSVTDGKLYYNNGFWDTYRTTWAAYALLTPTMDSEMLNGLVQHYVDQNWVPRWVAPGGTDSMVGTNSDVIFGDAINRGISFDVDDAYRSALKNGAVVSDNTTNGGRKGLENSIFDGYTSNSVGEGMSWSMEGYINDYGISQLAKYKGDNDAYLYYRNRALNYVNLFSTELGGWFSGKSRSGVWTFGSDLFNPKRWGGDYTETNAWNMAFSVPQDGRGLANLYGGKENLAKKLDAFFSTQGDFDAGGYGGEIHEMKEAREIKLGQYGHSNQPSHHIPYMYDFAGRPDRTQQVVRDILSRVYVGSAFGQGYIGDEDNGEMSGWYIFSALGFYPVNMGNGELAIGSPLFKKATIHLENGNDLVINAPDNSKENVYVQGVKFNGQDYSRCYFLSTDLAKGGEIDFDMGSGPSKWGSADSDEPTSITQGSGAAKPIADMTATSPSVLSTAPPAEEESDSVYSAQTASAAQLFDNSSATTVSFTPGQDNISSVYYSFSMPVYVDMYTITSGTDKSKAPTDFTLYGSNDGSTWERLDDRTGVTFDWNKYTRPFAVNGGQAKGKYQQYRLDMSNGSSSLEVAELELMGNLDKSFDRDYLRALILQGSGLDVSNTPSIYVQQLDSAITSAKAVWNNQESSDQQIYNAVVALRSAMSKISQHYKDAYATPFEAESYDQSQGIVTDTNSSRSGGGNIGGVQDGEWVKYNNVDFGQFGASRIDAYYASSNSNSEAVAGHIDVVLDSLNNTPAVTIPTHTTGAGWNNYVLEGMDINPAITGVHDVYMRFYSQSDKYVANVDYFQLMERDTTSEDLQNAIQQANSLNELNYTAESWNSVKQAVADAQNLLDGSSASSADIKAAIGALETAIGSLMYAGNSDSPDFQSEVTSGSFINLDAVSLKVLADDTNPLDRVEIRRDGSLLDSYSADDLTMMAADSGTGSGRQKIYDLDLNLTDSGFGDGRYDITAVKQTSSSSFSFVRDTVEPVITYDDSTLPPCATISDSHLDSVTVDGRTAIPDNGKLTFCRAGSHDISATDRAGNISNLTVDVESDTYKITAAAANSHGSISPSSLYVREGDDSGEFTIRPAGGYKVSQITISSGDALDASDDKSTVFVKDVSSDASINVAFRAVESRPNSNNGSTVSSSGGDGSVQTFTDADGIQRISVTPAVTVNAGGSLVLSVPGKVLSTIQTASGQTPAVDINIPGQDLINLIRNVSPGSPISLGISLPSQLTDSSYSKAPVSLKLSRDVLETIRQQKADFVVTVMDSATNTVLYSWSWKGSDLGSYQGAQSDIDIALRFGGLPADGEIRGAVPAAVSGLLLDFQHSGLLPAPAQIRLNLAKRFQPGQTLYLYYFNSETGSLEFTSQASCTVDGSGYATIEIGHCSQYILVPQPVPAVPSIRLDTGRNLRVRSGGLYQFRVTASSRPTFVAGYGSVFSVSYVGRIGSDYFFTVKAVGRPGEGCGLYLNGEKKPRTVAAIV